MVKTYNMSLKEKGYHDARLWYVCCSLVWWIQFDEQAGSAFFCFSHYSKWKSN